MTPALVVVTGAGSGIGRATAERFADDGACVIASDIDGDAAAETVERITARGGNGHAYVLDVRDADAWDRFAAQIRAEHGVPDVLVNNAGIALIGAILEQSAAEWEQILAVNLMGAVHGCRAFGCQMVERGQGGHIVNVASCAAWLPNRLLGSYAVTKAAVLMLSECLRVELAGQAIGVTAICPSMVRSNIAANAVHAAVSAEEASRRRDLSAAAQALWPVGPDKVARAITRGVRSNSAIVPVNPDAWLSWAIYRLSPGLARGLARLASLDGSLALLDGPLSALLRFRGAAPPSASTGPEPADATR